MSEKKSFWSTLPGILTGTATVISAGLGLMGVLNSGDSNPAGNPQQAVESSPSPTPSNSSSSSSSAVFTDFPEAAATPDSVNFGKQGLTDSAPQTVTVLNSGESDLEFGEIAIAGEDAGAFKVVSDTCGSESISPDSRCQIKVVFTPGSVGPYTATLELEHNAQDTPTEVPLSGDGVLLQL